MIPDPLVCWGCRCLIFGTQLNGELDAVSGPYRRLLDHLASLPVGERQGAFNAFLKRETPEEEAAIIKAVADQDPEGQPPAPEADAKPAAGPAVRMTCAANITPQNVEWLWRSRIPLGMPSTLAGDPKLGKSWIALAIAAAVSRGAPLPGGDIPEEPGSVIIMSAEDDPSRTIVPRLKALGADLTKIHILESIFLEDRTEALPSLRHDIATIEAAAAGLGDCRLIIIDPVTAYLGGIDDHRNAELRGVLTPLKRLAERLNVAVVMVSHLSKSGGVNGKHRVIGSIAYVGVSRANFLFAKDRTDPTGRRVLMLDNGGNLAPTAPTLAYAIEDRGDGPRVEWLDEPVTITVEQALAAETEASQPGDDRAAERKAAEQWLKEVLSSGPVPSTDVNKAARDCGIAIKTLGRAKNHLGVVSTKTGFAKDTRWNWSLPGASKE